MKENYNCSSMRNAIVRISTNNIIRKDNKELGLKVGDIKIYEKKEIVKLLEDWCETKKFEYFMIEHNEDEDNKHFHIVLCFDAPTPFATIKKKFPFGDIEKCKHGIKNAIQYLVHLNDESKIQYSWDEVINNAPAKLEIYKIPRGQGERDKLKIITDKIISGEIKECEIEKIDQNIYIRHTRQIKSAFDYYRKKQQKNPSRNINVVVLQGEPGSGKTTLCKIIAQRENKTICFSSASNDAVQDYQMGADYFVFDDFDYNSLEVENFKKLTDNNTCSSSKSRYTNKYVNSDIFICTNIPIIDWYKGTSKENLDAIARRITCVLDFLPMQDDHIIRYYIKSIDDLHNDRNPFESKEEVNKKYKLCEVDMTKYISMEDGKKKKEDFFDILKQL